MKNAIVLSAALLCAAELGAASKGEAIASARIFAVDYTRSQETVKAQLAKGSPEEIQSDPRVIEAYLGRAREA